jgi:outer membrane receptor protein involved in Fe transport
MFSQKSRIFFYGSSALVLVAALNAPAFSQEAANPPAASPPATPAPSATASSPPPSQGATVLPEIDVAAPKRKAKETRRRPTQATTNVASGTATTAGKPIASAIDTQNQKLDGARVHMLSPDGANVTTLSSEAIQAMPQGKDAPLDKVLLQFPGVSQDSAASGELHVRNEHANLQYRVNGIMLPDGVGAFGQILDTNIIGSASLITGALPAQYGLRTAGVLDITTRSDLFNNSGTVSVYGGSHGTITPSFEYGGTAGDTQYFFSGRYFGSDLGLENPTSAKSAIHDHTDQEKGFAYISTKIDDYSRLVFMGGTSTATYQIPNNPGQPIAFGTTPFNSAQLNERQTESNQFGVFAYQRSYNGLDVQLSYFSRYSALHFSPDPVGDLAFNGVASDVFRQSIINGIQADAAYRLTTDHTIRFGTQISGEKSTVNNTSTAFALVPPPDTITFSDNSSKLGWLFSAYMSDEWKITNQLTLTTGLRFDQMMSYINANQLSPRVNLTYKPFDGTVVHAGYARNFTPPEQVLAAPTNIALTTGTTQQPGITANSPVQPERSHVFDVGVDQVVLPGLTLGVDAYYKTARNLLDDGQFGAAYVLTAFNYDKGYNAGVEFKGKYVNGNFQAYANLAIAKQRATNVVSNQFLFDPSDFNFIQSNYVYTDHAQIFSGSAGASYLWNGTRFSADLIYGSGLRADLVDASGNTVVPNGATVPSYAQVNVGVSHEFAFAGYKPLTVRFDVVNLFDKVYEIRDGSGIGVFAPQFGPRRGFFAGLSQKF